MSTAPGGDFSGLIRRSYGPGWTTSGGVGSTIVASENISSIPKRGSLLVVGATEFITPSRDGLAKFSTNSDEITLSLSESTEVKSSSISKSSALIRF